MTPPQYFRHGLLVDVVGHGPEQAYGNGLHAARNQGVQGHRRLILVEPHGHRALVVHAFVDLGDQRTGNEGLGLLKPGQPAGLGLGESVGDLALHHQQGVGEATGGHEAGPGTRAGDQGVLADGAGVKEERSLPEKLLLAAEADVTGRVPDRVGGARGEVRRGGKRFAHRHLALVVDHDAVGEGAADVHSNAITGL